jgi:hypothetical protein
MCSDEKLNEGTQIAVEINTLYRRLRRYRWTISSAEDWKVIARGQTFTARGAIKKVAKVHEKLERDTLRYNGRVGYNLVLTF